MLIVMKRSVDIDILIIFIIPAVYKFTNLPLAQCRQGQIDMHIFHISPQ